MTQGERRLVVTRLVIPAFVAAATGGSIAPEPDPPLAWRPSALPGVVRNGPSVPAWPSSQVAASS